MLFNSPIKIPLDGPSFTQYNGHMSDRFEQHDHEGLSSGLGSEDDAVPYSHAATREGQERVLGSELVVLPAHYSRDQAVAYLSKTIDTNQYGLPQYFIRSDLLNLQGDAISQDDIDAASVGLHYHDGYPTLENGQAFWNQLPHEPSASFRLFLKYVEQAEEQGIRQLDLLAVAENEQLQNLRSLYNEFYWSTRARAYDLFNTAAELRKRQMRIRSMENKHFDLAQKRMDELLSKFEDKEWFEELNAKEAIEAIVELAKLQRLSVGLTGNNASSLPKNPMPEGASVEHIMEQLTRGANMSQDSGDSFHAKLTSLLNDPESGMQVQEAILRFGRPDVLPASNGATLGEDM
jgi:hypothetical protein